MQGQINIRDIMINSAFIKKEKQLYDSDLKPHCGIFQVIVTGATKLKVLLKQINTDNLHFPRASKIQHLKEA